MRAPDGSFLSMACSFGLHASVAFLDADHFAVVVELGLQE